MRIAASILVGEVGKARQLPVLQNTVWNAQAAHVRTLCRRYIKQPIEAPTKIVGRLGRFVLARLVLQPLVAIEWMQFSLEFFLISELATRSQYPVLRLNVDRVRAGRLIGRTSARPLPARSACRVKSRGKTLQITLLIRG